MALKTKKPGFSSLDATEQLSSLIDYIEELSDEIEFRFEVLTSSVEKLRRLVGNTEGSDAT